MLAHKTSFLFSVSIVLAIVCYPIKEGLSRTATQSNLSLTPSSLGFFEHSQPGGVGIPSPHRNFFIINANQMKLCTIVK